jgi:hypothetical protein
LLLKTKKLPPRKLGELRTKSSRFRLFDFPEELGKSGSLERPIILIVERNVKNFFVNDAHHLQDAQEFDGPSIVEGS